MTPPTPPSHPRTLGEPPPPRVLAIVGPTAVGKTAVAEEIAVRLGAEIVSADSMQVYRGMDIGTAKPSPEARRVPYWCLDLVDPGEPFSAALYQHAARAAIEDIAARSLVPVVAGGTGLYVRAALDDLSFPAREQSDNPVRERYERYARDEGGRALYEMLLARDPESAALIHPNNTRRVIRALEMLDGGVPYTEQQKGFSARNSIYNTVFVGLTMERALLYERVDQRVDAMLDAGLLQEVERLLEAGFRDALTASQAIGYKEFVPVLEGRADLVDAIDEVKRASRRYAKRQLTWFRADPRIEWVSGDDMSPQLAADTILGALDWDRASSTANASASAP